MRHHVPFLRRIPNRHIQSPAATKAFLSAYRVQEMNYLTEDVENFLESEDCGFSISNFGKNGLQDIALLFRDKYNDCNIPYWTGIRHAVERYAKENNIEPHFDDEEFSGPDNEQ